MTSHPVAWCIPQPVVAASAGSARTVLVLLALVKRRRRQLGSAGADHVAKACVVAEVVLETRVVERLEGLSPPGA